MKIEQIKDETIIDLKRTLTECCCNKKAFCLTEFILSFNGYDSQTLYKKGWRGNLLNTYYFITILYLTTIHIYSLDLLLTLKNLESADKLCRV